MHKKYMKSDRKIKQKYSILFFPISVDQDGKQDEGNTEKSAGKL